ncbi:uncharacterized protein LOC107043970 [Diachasma alloeum]|uniref:uncharacterized protein LOC107043970 n=1 Tax=Diachasma alloeum TaxID=454923 RepID=UPI0007383F91|nr:uncharacterized protein LOC107043970 [Diachasma alloeum]
MADEHQQDQPGEGGENDANVQPAVLNPALVAAMEDWLRRNQRNFGQSILQVHEEGEGALLEEGRGHQAVNPPLPADIPHPQAGREGNEDLQRMILEELRLARQARERRGRGRRGRGRSRGGRGWRGGRDGRGGGGSRPRGWVEF